VTQNKILPKQLQQFDRLVLV